MSDARVPARDAASLILYHRAAAGIEILMGRRGSDARFGPGYYVFPGGTAIAADAEATPGSSLRAEVSSQLKTSCVPGQDRQLAMAAVRETFEETGLLVGVPGDSGAIKERSWQAIRATGLAPALAKLAYVGRALTPNWSPIRFHARFFMADVTDAVGELNGDGELQDLQWFDLDRAAALRLMDVTEFMLGEVAGLLGDSSFASRRRFFTYTSAGPLVQIDEAEVGEGA
jgi:8-oxo-dGTP pyrophosphatase MutT (NUDIX family)